MLIDGYGSPPLSLLDDAFQKILPRHQRGDPLDEYWFPILIFVIRSHKPQADEDAIIGRGLRHPPKCFVERLQRHGSVNISGFRWNVSSTRRYMSFDLHAPADNKAACERGHCLKREGFFQIRPCRTLKT